MKQLGVLAALCLAFASCNKEKLPVPQQQSEVMIPSTVATAAPGFPEGFESGNKTAYAAGNVSLNSGSWNFMKRL